MAEVGAALPASDLDAPHPEREVGRLGDLAVGLLVDRRREGGPAALAQELVARSEQRLAAADALVGPRRVGLPILAGERPLRPLHPRDLELLGREPAAPFLERLGERLAEGIGGILTVGGVGCVVRGHRGLGSGVRSEQGALGGRLLPLGGLRTGGLLGLLGPRRPGRGRRGIVGGGRDTSEHGGDRRGDDQRGKEAVEGSHGLGPPGAVRGRRALLRPACRRAHYFTSGSVLGA